MTIPETSQLAVSKAIEQLAFVDRSYGLGIWPSETTKAEWKFDLGVMHAYKDLESVRLELLAADNTVLCEFRIRFNGDGGQRRLVDFAGGVELPVIGRRLVAAKRVIIQRDGREAAYRHLLKMNWTSAVVLQKRPGDFFESEHAKKITDGTQSGTIHVGGEARHRLVITQVGQRGYAFAKGLDIDIDGVFVHSKFAPPNFSFEPGKRISALLVQTPKGIQARSVQNA